MGWWLWGLLGLLTALSPQAEGGWQPPERWCEQLFTSVVPVLLGGPEEEPGGHQLLDLNCFLSDISDTLFTMTGSGQPGADGQAWAPPPCPTLLTSPLPASSLRGQR